MGILHGDGIAAISVELQDVIWQTFGFLAKNKKTARLEGGLDIAAHHLGGEEEELQFALCGEKGVEIRPVADGDVLPVVKSGPLEVLVIEGKPQGMDEVEHRIGRSAESRYRPGIGGNLRLDENDIVGLVANHDRLAATGESRRRYIPPALRGNNEKRPEGRFSQKRCIFPLSD